MDIRIVDRERHVTRVPTKGPPFGDDLFAVMDGLLSERDNANPAVEFECDWEFFRGLEAAGDKRLEEPAMPWADGHRAMYRNTPIMVTGDEPAEYGPATAPEPTAEPAAGVRTTKDAAP